MEKRLKTEYPDLSDVINHQHLCLEADVAMLLKYYGKGYALPLGTCFDFSFVKTNSLRVADGINPIGDITEAYGKYGLKILKTVVKDFDDYSNLLRKKIDENTPVIIHLDCFYLPWDPKFRDDHNNHTVDVYEHTTDLMRMRGRKAINDLYM